MKFLIPIFFLAALATSGFAQSNSQIDTAIRKLLSGTGRQPASVGGPASAAISSGLIGTNSALALSADTNGNLIVHNTSNGFTHKIVFPAPTANRTTTFPIGGGTVSTSPSTLSYQFTGATYNAVVTQVEPTVGSTVVTLPDTAGVNVSIPLSTLTTNAIDAANSVWFVSNGIKFEGATADGFEDIIQPVDPTADQTFSLPNTGGNAALLFSTLTTNTVDAANSIWLISNGIVAEGATADASETTITFTDPTADRTVTVPDVTGTMELGSASVAVSLTADDQVVTPGKSRIIQLSSDNATATNRTFTLSATGAITGWTYILVGPATNQCEMADTSIQKLSATWSPTTTDTITLLFDGTNFIELARAVNH